MARHNYVSLIGSVVSAPRIVDLEESQRATMTLKVIKGDRDSHDGDIQLKVTYPIIISLNKHMVEIMSKLQPNDIVIVKGNLITATVDKGYKACPYCDSENIFPGLITYVNPIDILVHKQNIEDPKEALKIILENKEFSNEVCVIGHLCTPPEQVATLKSVPVVQYKLGIPRKFRIKEDPLNVKSDFPYIKSFGQNAIDDLDNLKTGSTVLIDGYLQARKFPKKIECSNCGKTYEDKDTALEIVTYHTEYLRHCKHDDEEDDDATS